MSEIGAVELLLRDRPRGWLVTGGAGFIGSHLCAELLVLGQEVVVFDDFSTGTRANVDALVHEAGARGAEAPGERLRIIEADVRDFEALLEACAGVDHVLHQAALASVPRTLAEPRLAHAVNVDGSFNVFEAARQAGARSVVHASSSAVYGDCPGEPETGAQIEARVGRPLSPYAGHKRVAEVLGQALTRSFGLPIVALRYFNIVGPRQDPAGPYAAVIPRWCALLARGEQPVIFGDGRQTRDFCPVQEVVQANLLAATWAERRPAELRERPGDPSEAVFNVGLGQATDLLGLYAMIHAGMVELGAPCAAVAARHEAPRPGDIVHSRANIDRARDELGYVPRTPMQDVVRSTMQALFASKA